MSVRLQVKKEINILLKICLEFVSLELSVKTVYAIWITKFLHGGEEGLYWHWKGREFMSRAITVKHINLHLFSIVLPCIFIQTNRKLDRVKAYEGSCFIAQGPQPGALWWPEGVAWRWGGHDIQQDMYNVCIHIADSLHCKTKPNTIM